MNGDRQRNPRILKREVESKSLMGRAAGDQAEYKAVAKVEQLNQAGELESLVESQVSVLGCGHVGEPFAVCRCGRTLCELDGKVLCYGCGQVTCTSCQVKSLLTEKIVYHRGWCRFLSVLTRIWRG